MLEARYMQAAAWMFWIQRSICIDVTSIKVLSAVWCSRRWDRENECRHQGCREDRAPGFGEFDHGQPFHRDLPELVCAEELTAGAGAAISLPAVGPVLDC
jgi:hypothetical protein